MAKEIKRKNPVFDELFFKKRIKELHDELVSSYKIPNWLIIDCPSCDEKITTGGLRKFGLCLNARNIGDIFIEFHCLKCSISSTVYFRENISSLEKFCSYLKIDGLEPSVEPITEDEMYSSGISNFDEKISTLCDKNHFCQRGS